MCKQNHLRTLLLHASEGGKQGQSPCLTPPFRKQVNIFLTLKGKEMLSEKGHQQKVLLVLADVSKGDVFSVV